MQNVLISALLPGSCDLELVAREAEDHETLILVFFVVGFERGVLRGVAALGSDVDYEHHLALVGFQGGVLAVDILDGHVVDRPGVRRDRL